jgi:hypothetical protein
LYYSSFRELEEEKQGTRPPFEIDSLLQYRMKRDPKAFGLEKEKRKRGDEEEEDEEMMMMAAEEVEEEEDPTAEDDVY